MNIYHILKVLINLTAIFVCINSQFIKSPFAIRPLVIGLFFISCNSSNGTKLVDKKDEHISNSDSIELTNLVRKAYKWHETKFRRNGFPFKFNSPNDTIFTGVDLHEYSNDMKVFKSTNFFSKDFFKTHGQIAQSIDSSIKQTSIEWRNINDGISLWDTDSDDWCNCQDYPDNYWESMTLNNFSFSKDNLTFYWTWGSKNEKQYEIKARKEDGIWKISYLQGFTNYQSLVNPSKQ